MALPKANVLSSGPAFSAVLFALGTNPTEGAQSIMFKCHSDFFLFGYAVN